MPKSLRETLDRQLSALDWTPEDTRQVLRQMRGEKPVRYTKSKLSAALAVALILVCLAAAALAVGAAFGLFTTQVAGMAATGQMAAWGLPEKLVFITAMKEAGMNVDAADWALLTDPAQREEARGAAADRMVYAQYGALQEEQNALYAQPAESVLGQAPDPVVIFRAQYLAEHADAQLTDQAYLDALGYWLRDEYVPQLAQAIPKQALPDIVTEAAELTADDVKAALRSDMTEVFSWPQQAAQGAQITVSYDEVYDVWLAQGEVAQGDMAGAAEPVLADERVTPTAAGYRLTGWYGLDKAGNWLRAASKATLLDIREAQNHNAELYTLLPGDAASLAAAAVQAKYGLTAQEVSRYFAGNADLYWETDCIRVSVLFRTHNNLGNDWAYAAIVNLTTAQVDDVFTPEDLWDRLPLLAQAYPRLSYAQRLNYLRWYYTTWNPLYGFYHWPLDKQAEACQLFWEAAQADREADPQGVSLLDEFTHRRYTLPQAGDLSQEEAVARVKEAAAQSAGYSPEKMQVWETVYATFAQEDSGQRIWRLMIENGSLPQDVTRTWWAWVDATTGELLYSGQRGPGDLIDDAL